MSSYLLAALFICKRMIKLFIYKITNILTNEVYVGQTINIEKRLKGHYISDNFRKYVNDHGRKILNIEILKEVPDNLANKIECIETLKCKLNGEKVLNDGYGTYSKKAIEECINKFPDYDAKKIYEELLKKTPITRTINTSQNFYVLKIYNDDGEIYFGKSTDRIINLKKTKRLFNNPDVKLEIVKKCSYEEAFELCFHLCIKSYLKGEKIVNIYYGKMRGDVIKNIHKYSPWTNYKEIIREYDIMVKNVYICN